MKRITKKIAFALIIMLAILGLPTSWSIFQWTISLYKDQKVIEKSTELVPATYCAKDIDANEKITADQVELRHVELKYLPANACDCVYVPIGRSLKYARKKGEPLCLEDFGLLKQRQ